MADKILYYICGRHKRGDEMSSAKIGRPTTNPKEERITVRLDAESIAILKDYCLEKQTSKAEAIRIGIKSLKK